MSKIKNFPYSVWYLILLSSITLVIWSFHLENVGIPAVLVLMFLFFVFSKDTMPTVPLFMNGLFMVSQTNWSFETIPLFIFMTPLAIIGGMIVHIIKYRVDIFKGKMLLGIGIMILAMALSSINAVTVDLYYFFYCLIGVFYALVYMFYRNTFDRDHTAYLMKMMLILGILISAQVVIYYLYVEDIRIALEQKSINLGWGISNYIATYLIMFISITFYFVKKTKFGFLWIFVAVGEMVMLVFTASRGGMVAFAVLLPILIVLLFWKAKNWWKFILSFLFSAVILYILIYYNYDFVSSVLFRFENLMFDDSGRFEIYLDALSKFMSNPLFGAGLFARTGTGDFRMFHNTFLHTLATMGLVGIVGLIVQLWTQFKITIGKFKNVNLFLVVALLGAHIHGMVDNIYYMPQFMILMLLIVSVAEFSTELEVSK